MMNRTRSNEYFALGRAIASARVAAGMAKQSDLALALKVSQQTVSRWEAGITKPKEKQLQALGALLKLNGADVRRLAGDEGPPAVSFVEPFPVDRLTPTAFEQFVADLVSEEYPGAEVRRAGGSGHKQDGIDVEIITRDGQRIGIQCKKVRRFGPADVDAAAEAFPADNYEKVLVLSRIASPQTVEAVRSHQDWTLWDKDDLTRRVRRLPMEVQERLVDIYFRGQRQALLGRAEAGPWLTTETFFSPFEGTDRPLSHSWEMLGREKEKAELIAALDRPGARLLLLVASGGMGKSRLLKEVVETYIEREPSVCVRFLSTSADASRQALGDLGPGSKILVIDDAHDREGLGVLFEYAGDPSNQTRLLLATRNYALDRICGEAATYNHASPVTVVLEALSREQLRGIARQILKHFEIENEELAKYVVAASGDSPMIVAMAAKVLAQDKLPVELAKNTDAFRNIVLGKFAKIVAGHIGSASDEKTHRDVLNLLALVQPFHPEDPQLFAALEALQGMPKAAASAALDRLSKGGVIFRRGHQWRLMPDVLGDYLIETSCCDAAGNLSPYAEAGLAVAKDTLLRHALVNLGRFDWRRSGGDTADSAFLRGVWRTFDDIEDDYDPRLDAIKSVSLYQPSQALDFVIGQVRRKRFLRALPEILSSIACTSEHLKDVMTLLWTIGRNDDRDLGRNPGHAIRVLTELGSYDGRKPALYCKTLLQFALDLLNDKDNWKGCYTPLSLLQPLLSTAGTNDISNGRSISMTPYFINYEVVGPIRAVVIDTIIGLMRHENVAVACAAASSLGSAVTYPLGAFNSKPPPRLRAALTTEFVETLTRVKDVVTAGVHPLVAIAVAKAVSWLANFGPGKPSQIASEILDNLPRDLEFRFAVTLVDGWGRIFLERGDPNRWQADLERWLGDVARDLGEAMPDPGARLAYLEKTLSALKDANEGQSSSHMVIHKLVEDERFARVLLDDALARTASLTRSYVGPALHHLTRKDKAEGRGYAWRLINSGDHDLMVAAANAYGGQKIERDDEEIIRTLLQSSNTSVVWSAIRAVWVGEAADERDAIDLLVGANIANDKRLAEELAMALMSGRSRLITYMTEEDASGLLERLKPIGELDGYWLDEMLADFSFRFPLMTARFFMDRVELASEDQSYSFRAANFGPYSHKKLRFVETSEVFTVLEIVWNWMRENRERDHYFQYAVSHMFDAMFMGSVDLLIEFFQPLLKTADAGDLRLIGQLLREAHHDFVFDRVSFVTELLEQCQAVDFELHKLISQQLYASSISGIRQGLPGEPMPRDLADKQKSGDILARLSRLSPAHDLFSWIKEAAIRNIEGAKRDAEGFDE